jgi:tRNA G18 (ribose-2'-O)-methylase SpoU
LIHTAADPLLDDYRQLRDPGVRARVEAEQGFFIAEGITVVRRLLASTLRVRSVLVMEGREDRVADLLSTPNAAPLHVVSSAVMNELVGFDLHRGVLASADRPEWASIEHIARNSRRVAVLEGINDHENLGAIARSARALGFDALVLDPTTADPWYRRSVRVSMGEIVALPMARCADWPAPLDVLRSHGFTVVALTPAADSTNIADIAAVAPERVAIMLGAEGPGLSAAALAAADVRARIPIRADVDSLNVGHAAAIAFAAFGYR